MREIKFRAWKDGEMHYARFVGYLGGYGCLFQNFNGEPEALMQFTGLKDKNGKDIHEGDILQTTWRLPSTAKQSIAKAEFQNGCFGIEWIGEKHPDDVGFHPAWSREDDDFAYIDRMVIIGNIYENPELLED